MAFEQFLNQKKERGGRKTWRALTYSVSLALHGALLLGLLVRSFWHVDELQPKGVVITMMSLRVPPPPPPPAPAAHKNPDPKPRAVAVVRPKPTTLVQPADKPKVETAAPPKEEEVASNDDDGVAGGVEGGVSGGVETAAAPPPPPPPPRPVEVAPVMLPPNIGTGQRLSDVINDSRFRPSLPPALNHDGVVVWGLFRICVASDGKVKDVKILKSADRLVDASWTEIIHRWEYRPYSIDGRPIPFCHAARIEVQARL
jgi:protein TonB